MPTKPDKDFIPRNIENPEIQEILNQYSLALEEVVNFASNVAKWCSEKIHGGEELAPVIMSFRHIFELIDAISVLIRDSCIEPCKILLRSVYESVLSVKYILEKETETRGMDFMTCCWHQIINNFRKMNPNDSMHKQFLAKKRRDKLMKNVPLPKIPDVEDRIKILEDHLTSQEYIESEREFQCLKSIIKRKPQKTPKRKLNWYSMHEGPANIEGLANHLELPLEYELLYREWSGLVHGIDIIINNIEVVDEDRCFISQIRLPEDAFDVTTRSMNFGLEIIPPFIEYFVPEKVKVAKDWYNREIVPLKSGKLRKNRIIVKSKNQ